MYDLNFIYIQQFSSIHMNQKYQTIILSTFKNLYNIKNNT